MALFLARVCYKDGKIKVLLQSAKNRLSAIKVLNTFFSSDSNVTEISIPEIDPERVEQLFNEQFNSIALIKEFNLNTV